MKKILFLIGLSSVFSCFDVGRELTVNGFNTVLLKSSCGAVTVDPFLSVTLTNLDHRFSGNDFSLNLDRLKLFSLGDEPGAVPVEISLDYEKIMERSKLKSKIETFKDGDSVKIWLFGKDGVYNSGNTLIIPGNYLQCDGQELTDTLRLEVKS